MTGYKIPKGFVEGYRNAIERYPKDSQYAWGMNAVVEALEVYPLEELDDNPWHTGTPTENGYYLCKVFYDKDTPNDMRILEWVSSLNCFCIPYSEIRAYHYYVGENNGEDVEVVYEWQKLDMRFRMETKWIVPYKEKKNET